MKEFLRTLRLLSCRVLFPIVPLFASLCGIAQNTESLPFRYRPAESETYEDVARKFSLDPEFIETLNPTLWAPPEKLLLVAQPRNAQEAILLLEEAKRVEILGGVGAEKATLLYRGILVAAGLIPSGSNETSPVEMPSDTVAQALLAWGKIHESTDPHQSEWAYRQVRIYFPDREHFYSLATSRLNRMEHGESPMNHPAPPSGLEWFPVSPHVLIDIDAKRLEKQLRDLRLLQTFAPLHDHPDEKVAKRYSRWEERWKEVFLILSHIKTVHIGGWVDAEIYAENPERGLRESRWLVIGDLETTFREFAAAVDMPSPVLVRGEFQVYDIGKGTFLATDGEQVLVGEREVLEYLIDRGPPFVHPELSDPQSGYRQARATAGPNTAVFGYFDLEGFLKGPALAFARRADPSDEDAFFGSLVVAGLIGFNSIRGFSFSLDCDRGTLDMRASLCHRGEGILALFSGPPCSSRTLRYYPRGIHGFFQVVRPCTPAVEGLFDLDPNNLFGVAAPVIQAHYNRVLELLDEKEGFYVDPLRYFRSGLFGELSVGLQIPGGMVPIPNVLVAAPTTLASAEIRHLEKLLAFEGKVTFRDGNLGGVKYRHAVIPIEPPLFLDLSYTLHDETLLVSNNTDLLEEAIRGKSRKGGLSADAEFQEFCEEWFPSNHAILYLSNDLVSRLARLGRALVSTNLDDPVKEPFVRIFQEQMDPLIEEPNYSGLGLRLGDDRVVIGLQLRSFRQWCSAFLSLRWMKLVEQWKQKEE